MNDEKKFRSKSAKERTTRIFIYVLLTVLSIIWLIPFIYLIFQAFRGESKSMVTYIFPKEWSFENFRILFKECIKLISKISDHYVNILYASPDQSVYNSLYHGLSKHRY